MLWLGESVWFTAHPRSVLSGLIPINHGLRVSLNPDSGSNQEIGWTAYPIVHPIYVVAVMVISGKDRGDVSDRPDSY
ncbi:hypothetical protein [Moorena producens]|uniref:hypothetical protein n=1 Tax=Moorena producens TaxID=1155739 RepID=UPI003C74336D